MEITFRVEILILIVVALVILWGHLLCSCSKVDFNSVMSGVAKKLTPNQHQYDLVMSNPSVEGFTPANINNGQSAPYSTSYNKPVDTSSWFTPNLTFKAGETPGKNGNPSRSERRRSEAYCGGGLRSGLRRAATQTRHPVGTGEPAGQAHT